jgi:hypothetical protein
MALTPRQFDDMSRRRLAIAKRSEDMTEVMCAQIIAKVHNTSLGGCKHPIRPEDVMPSLWKQKTDVEKSKTKRQRKSDVTGQVRAGFEYMRALHGVKVLPVGVVIG